MGVATMTTDAQRAAAAVDALFGRVALTHEWLTIHGGSENVVERLLGIVPDAELFTSVYEPSNYGPPISAREVHTSFIDRLPGARTHYPKLLPLMNQAFRRFDLDGFDLVVSSQSRVREERAHAGRARSTSATATRRCATRGSRSSSRARTSGRSDGGSRP